MTECGCVRRRESALKQEMPHGRVRACGMDMRSDDWMKKWPWKLLTRTPLLHRMRMTASQPADTQPP